MYSFSNLKSLISIKRAFAFSLGIFALVFSFSANIFAAKGNLDRTFGSGGTAISFVNGAEKAFDAVVQPDGKIVVVGGSALPDANWDFLIQRYNADGTLDQSFGQGGKNALAISTRSEVAYAVTLQSDGKIIVAGYIQQPNNYSDYCIVRLLPNGQLDQTFATAGVQIFSVTQTSDIPVSLAMQTLGGVERIVVGGYVNTAPAQFSVARLNLNGQLDATFGEGGLKTVSVGGNTDILQDIAIDSQGKIVAVGSSRFDAGGGSFRDDFAAVRFLSDGSLDTTFSGDGKVITQMAGLAQARSVVIQNIDGLDKIVAGGFARNGANNDFALTRYNPDGTLDMSFDTDGKVYTNFVHEEQIQELLIQPNGQIIGVGFMNFGVNQNFAAARYNTNGSLDKTFGSCGRITTDLRTNTDIAYGATIQPDGKVIAVGESVNGSTSADFTVVRYTTGGQAAATSTDFDGDGKEDVSVYRPSDGTWYMNCSCGGFRAVNFGASSDIPQAADYDGDGRTDQAVFRSGTWYIKRSSNGEMMVINFGAAGDIPTVGDYDGDDKADVSVWRGATGVWYVLRSSDNQYTETAFGQAGDKPVAADYDADGKTDLAIYRGSGDWWIKKSSDQAGNLTYQKFGIQSDTALTGDFDGDGRADLNLFRASEGTWYQQLSNLTKITRFGISTDKPVAADYDGDNKADIAVFRSGAWYILYSSTNSYGVVSFGLSNDIPAVVR